ncbi:glycoside hydrolase superfamily, partial [Aspergillus avenaceus]
ALQALVPGALAGADLGKTNNVAAYWGQNSYGQGTGPYAQKRLSHYCNDPHIDIYMISFLIRFNGMGGVPETNFANAQNNCTYFPGTQLHNCPQIEEDIKFCQSRGKTILLSFGGSTYTEGGFTSEDAARSGAKLVWETFGAVNSHAKRPFGSAVVDGFDFDFESIVHNMPAFANELRRYMSEDGSRKYILTAAPQCPYPDAADGPMLDGRVHFDAVFIQFYNNYCGLPSFTPGSSSQSSYNFGTWDKWAKETSLNKNVKVYVGAAANTGAAGTGYVPLSRLSEIIQYSKQFSSFGGVMLWDTSQGYANEGFLPGLKSALGGGGGGNPPPITTTTTLTTTTRPKPTTTSTSTTTTTTAKPPSTTCPVQGGSCSTNGAFACNGSDFGVCDYGKWIMRSCPAGLVCAMDGTGAYCDYPGKSNSPCP